MANAPTPSTAGSYGTEYGYVSVVQIDHSGVCGPHCVTRPPSRMDVP